MFITCLNDVFYPRVGVATVKVLEHLGCDVSFPTAQTCCGQPMFNNGFHDEARRLASRMIEVFRDYDAIITPSGSCAAMVREHFPHLFDGNDPRAAAATKFASRTYEFVEYLVKVLKVDLRELEVAWPNSATYHPSCHLRGLGMKNEATDLITQITDLSYVELPNAEQCCGFGGSFAVTFPDTSREMVGDKVDAIQETGCRAVICNDAGCAMNISGACERAGVQRQFISLAEIIAEGLGLLTPETHTS